MMQKINTVLLVLVTGLSVYLAVSFFRLDKQVQELAEKQNQQANTPPVQTPSQGEVSPFDQPNNDPFAEDVNAKKEALKDATQIKFERVKNDFGDIKAGKKVKTTFKFMNSGDKPLLITNAVGSCGCTVPQWPQQPIAPGESGQINVEFDSEGKSGEQIKTVTVSANTNPPNTILTVRALVIPDN